MAAIIKKAEIVRRTGVFPIRPCRSDLQFLILTVGEFGDKYDLENAANSVLPDGVVPIH